MSDTNPFAKLQRLLDDKKASLPSAKTKGGVGPSSPASPAPFDSSSSPASSSSSKKIRKDTPPYHPTAKGMNGTPHKNAKNSHQQDEESALFLRTVNRLPHTAGNSQETQEDSVFKHAMQAAGIIPTHQHKGKKGAKKAAKQQLKQHPKLLSDKNRLEETLGASQANAENRRSNDPGLSSPPAASGSHSSANAKAPSGLTKPPIQRFDTPADVSAEDWTDAWADETAREAEKEAELFAKAMSDVAPVSKRGREVHSPSEPKKPPHPSGKTPAEIMQEIIDGRIEFAVQHTGEYMEGFVQGVSPEVLDKLRLGQFSPEGHVDLHGLNALQAYIELTRFIKNAYQRNMRTVTVITGRGINSPDGIAVIRHLIQEWLTHDPFKRVVLAFCSAQQRDGGAGALYVLLRKYKKSMGKIQWEIPYTGPDADF